MMQPSATTTKKIRVIYILTTFLCTFMVAWILIFPATAFVNKENPGLRDEIRVEVEAQSHHVLPPGLLTKYEGQTLVAYTHIFPAVFWSVAIPIQFHPCIRKNYRTFHKYLGRAFIYTSFLLMAGFAVILHKGLSYENYLEGCEPITIPGTDVSIVDAGLIGVAGMFLYTATMAINSAREKDFENHKLWVVRHCGWGLWVIVQRVLGFFTAPIYEGLYGQVAFPGCFRGSIFLATGILGIILSVGVSEYTVSLLKRDDRAKAR
jgi:hypothetical protein